MQRGDAPDRTGTAMAIKIGKKIKGYNVVRADDKARAFPKSHERAGRSHRDAEVR
jgi:hypothetical protein